VEGRARRRARDARGPGAASPAERADAAHEGPRVRGGYQYAHAVPEAYTPQEYLPDALRGAEYYAPGPFGFEREVGKRLAWWRELRARLGGGGDPPPAPGGPGGATSSGGDGGRSREGTPADAGPGGSPGDGGAPAPARDVPSGGHDLYDA
jgi:hypothetical protein